MPGKSDIVPRLLFIVDRPNWAHDFKTRNLMRLLGSEFDIRLRYHSEVNEEDICEANLVLIYYWLQFERMQSLASAFRRNRHKLLVGISSSYELEGDRQDLGLAVIGDFASGVFVNNLSLYRQYQPRLRVPVFYTPNGVDTRFYFPNTGKAPSSLLRVGWAGSLTNMGSDHRGYHEFIVPAAGVVEGVELLTAAREERWRGPGEMREFYRSLDVYVCASRTEGTPNPCLEAAACGVPLVTTCVGNMPELVRHGVNGFFVARDVDDIARRLRTLRDDPNLRTAMSRQIHHDIQAWDWSLRARAYRQMFQSMASKAADGNRVSTAHVKESAPDDRDKEFRVVALMSAYNEEDIIVPCLQYLIKQGLEVYLIDNWSTDSTVEMASEFLGKGLLAIEKFPEGGPPSHYAWKAILSRIEQLTEEIDADWFLFQDIDEIRVPAWPDLSLRDAILKVDREGFNSIDHTVATFYPLDNDFVAGADFETYFKYFEFSDRPGQFVEINACKNTGRRVSLTESGGHEMRFEGRRVYPFRFLLKHYPVRSQAHGERKIFRERKPRWDPHEKAGGWHSHYDHISEGHSFLGRPDDLELFSEAEFKLTTPAHGPAVVDWLSEQIRAMRSQPDKLVTLVNIELRKIDESVRSVANVLRKRTWQTVTAGRSSGQSERKREKNEFKRLRKQLAQRNKHIHVLLEQLTQRPDAVELVAAELTEARRNLVSLVKLLAYRQEVDGSSARVQRQDSVLTKVTIPFRSSSSRLYRKLKRLLPFPSTD